MKSVYAIVLNWNNYEDTKECIKSLKESIYNNLKIVLVDNNSQDGSVDQLEQEYINDKTTHIICNKQNYGFARGINVGIKYALHNNADFAFLLNNDAIVDKDCISNLVTTVSSDDRIAAAAPLIYYYNSKDVIWQGRTYFSFLRTGTQSPDKSKLIKNYPKELHEVNFVGGCAVIIRCQIFEKSGLFDPVFFFYGEDVDFSLRVRHIGYKLIIVPSAKAWHKITNIAQERSSPFVMYHRAKSRLLVLRKNFSSLYIIYGLLIHIFAYTPYRMWQIILGSKSITAALSWLKGTWHGLKIPVHTYSNSKSDNINSS